MLLKQYEALKVPQIIQAFPLDQSEGHEKYSPPDEGVGVVEAPRGTLFLGICLSSSTSTIKIKNSSPSSRNSPANLDF